MTWQDTYRAVKERSPSVYHTAIRYGEGVSIQHHLSLEIAADVEKALICLAYDLLIGDLNGQAFIRSIEK